MTNRRAYSLLELVVTTAIMASVVASTVALMRNSRMVWEATESDAASLVEAHATLRHVVRTIRQTKSVTSISGSSQSAGSLTVVRSDDSTLVYSLSGSNVLYGVNTATDTLAGGISQLYFIGYQSDAVTTAVDVDDIRCILCRVVVSLDRTSETTRTIECFAWLRAWQV